MVFGIFGGGSEDEDISKLIRYDKKGNYVPIVTRDSQNRIILAKGTIPYRPRSGASGSLITAKIRKDLIQEKLPGDDIGHIIPKGLGGSGDDRDNVFPQNARINRSIAFQEKMLRQRQQESQLNIKFEIKFFYDGSNRPSDISYFYTEEDQDGKVTGTIHIVLQNPDPRTTKEMPMNAVRNAFMFIRKLLLSSQPNIRLLITQGITKIFSGLCKSVQLSIQHLALNMPTTKIDIPSGSPSSPEFPRDLSPPPLVPIIISK